MSANFIFGFACVEPGADGYAIARAVLLKFVGKALVKIQRH